jgi:hypothetical protein
MPIGITFTKVTQFGVSNGPTYQGWRVVPAVPTGTENYHNPQGQILNGAAGVVIDAVGFLFADLKAFGFTMQIDPIQTGTPSPAQLAAATVTIHLKNCVGGVADYDIVLGVGQDEVQMAPTIPAGIDSDCTSIEVDGDANCDCDVWGLVYLEA